MRISRDTLPACIRICILTLSVGLLIARDYCATAIHIYICVHNIPALTTSILRLISLAFTSYLFAFCHFHFHCFPPSPTFLLFRSALTVAPYNFETTRIHKYAITFPPFLFLSSSFSAHLLFFNIFSDFYHSF